MLNILFLFFVLAKGMDIGDTKFDREISEVNLMDKHYS
jgi:hypothetical protein